MEEGREVGKNPAPLLDPGRWRKQTLSPKMPALWIPVNEPNALVYGRHLSPSDN